MQKVEVCSTTLPQMAIPRILRDPRYEEYRMELNKRTGERSTFISNIEILNLLLILHMEPFITPLYLKREPVINKHFQ